MSGITGPGCPWQSFTPGAISFCEKRLCGWIAEPANTWSSLAFVVAGAAIFVRARRKGNDHLIPGAIFCVLIGLGSVAFHGTGTFVGEVMDEGSMFMASMMMLAFNLRRLLNWSHARTRTVFLVGVALSLGALICFHDVGRDLFALEMLGALMIEVGIIVASRRARIPLSKYEPLGLMCVSFVVAYSFWILDYRHIVCNINNHAFGGHAAWHIMNAISCYFGVIFYEQFEWRGQPLVGRSALYRN